MGKYVVAVLLVALVVASVFAIWPAVASAPWEADSARMGDVNGGSAADRDAPVSPVSSRLEVEDAVRQALGKYRSGLPNIIERVDSEFLGEGLWEVTVEIRGSGAPLVAVFRVRDGTLEILPLNTLAENLVSP